MSTPGVSAPDATRDAPTPSTAAVARSLSSATNGKNVRDVALGPQPGAAVGEAAVAERRGAVPLAGERLRDPHAGDVLLHVGVDDRDPLARLGVGARRQHPEPERRRDQHRQHGERDQRQLRVGDQQRDRDPDDREQADDRLGEPGLQERRQRVDVRGHPRHDPARQLALVVVEPEPLQVGVAAHAQQVEQALAGPRGHHGLRRRRPPSSARRCRARAARRSRSAPGAPAVIPASTA